MGSDVKFVSLHLLQALASNPSVNSWGPNFCFQPIRLLYFRTSLVVYPSVCTPTVTCGFPMLRFVCEFLMYKWWFLVWGVDKIPWNCKGDGKDHFTHETEGPWPLHFKHSHRWERRSLSKFASQYAWGTNGVSECKMDVKVYMDSSMASNGSYFTFIWTIFKNHYLEVGLTRKLGDHGTLKSHNHWLIICEDPTWT